MKKLLISVKDSKTEFWSIPTAADTKAAAIRDFASIVSDGRTIIGQHPEDFDLYVLGSFDINTGVIEPVLLTHLANGSDLRPTKE